MFCWVQLYNEGKLESDVDAIKIKPIPNDVDDLKSRVIEELKLFNAQKHLIKVYPSGTKVFSRDKALHPGDSVPASTNPKDPLIMVLPLVYCNVGTEITISLSSPASSELTSITTGTRESGQSLEEEANNSLSIIPPSMNEEEFLRNLDQLNHEVERNKSGSSEVNKTELYPYNYFPLVLSNPKNTDPLGNGIHTFQYQFNNNNSENGKSSLFLTSRRSDDVKKFQIDKYGWYGNALLEDKRIYQILAPIYEFADKNDTREYKNWLIPSRKSIRSAIEILHQRLPDENLKDNYITNTINKFRKEIRFDIEYIIDMIEGVNVPFKPRTLLDVDSILNCQILKCSNYSKCKSIIGLEVERSISFDFCNECRGRKINVASSKKRRTVNSTNCYPCTASFSSDSFHRQQQLQQQNNFIIPNNDHEGKRIERIKAFAENDCKIRHSISRNCLQGAMLKEGKLELHKRIIMKLGGEDINEVKDLRFAIELFDHWRGSGELGKATELAIKIGKQLDNLLLLRQSIKLCTETIEMWKQSSLDREEEEEIIAGFSIKTLNSVTPDQLNSLARLHISIAKNYSNIRDAVNSNAFYESCDLVLSKSPVAANLKDRSVFFALYSGWSSLLYIGAIPDDGLVLQMKNASKFVLQAELHGDLVHICRSVAMKSLTLSRQGKFEEALILQKKLEEIYNAEHLCDRICEEYSCDHTAQNYGYSVLWYEILGRFDKAKLQIDFILEELMTSMPAANMHNSIMILFPVIFVLKEKGDSRKAEEVFLTYIFNRFYEFYGEDSTTYFLFIYEPLRVLLQLSREIDEGSSHDEEELEKLEDWVLSPKIGIYSEIQWGPMCAMGRDPFSIIAEICLMLAKIRHHIKPDNDQEEKLIQKGFDQAKMSVKCVTGNPGFAYAKKFQSDRIMTQFLNS